ncbi:MAG: dockerin type I domain-containing protein [Clostridium sp.]|nr:dockerin type I domain-containing protein [Clostridium sp.]
MVSITSTSEQKFIESIIVNGSTDEHYSLGLYKSGNSWKWCDGSSYSYSNWLIGQPDGHIYPENANEMYGSILACNRVDWPAYGKGEIYDVITFGYWNDVDESANEFICEWSNEIGKEQPGDADGDGKINISDLISFQKYLIGDQAFTSKQLNRSDLNNDGNVNVIDMVILRRKLMGM